MSNQQGPLVFFGGNNYHKIMSSNETFIIMSISDLIISEGLSFNLAQKPNFNKESYLARNASKGENHPNIKLISKNLLDIIHNTW